MTDTVASSTAPAEPGIPVYRVTFDTLGAELAERAVAAPCSAQDLAEEIRDHVEAAGYYDISVTVDLPAGRASISDDDGSDLGGADITGPGVGTPTTPGGTR
jgi:hypothetical protein